MRAAQQKCELLRHKKYILCYSYDFQLMVCSLLIVSWQEIISVMSQYLFSFCPLR